MLRSMIITTSFDFSVDAMIVRPPGMPNGADQEQALIWRLRILDLVYATYIQSISTAIDHQVLIDIQVSKWSPSDLRIQQLMASTVSSAAALRGFLGVCD